MTVALITYYIDKRKAERYSNTKITLQLYRHVPRVSLCEDSLHRAASRIVLVGERGCRVGLKRMIM